jgi:hypothetical protein
MWQSLVCALLTLGSNYGEKEANETADSGKEGLQGRALYGHANDRGDAIELHPHGYHGRAFRGRGSRARCGRVGRCRDARVNRGSPRAT